MSRPYDLIVLGGGSGGVRAARMAGARGKRVALVERGRLGGTCVNVGCIPKKLLAYGAHFMGELASARAYGWDVDVGGHDLAALQAKKDAEITRLNGIYARLLERHGVELVTGHGVVRSPHTIAVGDRTFEAEHLLVATGGRAVRPDVPGQELGWSSDDVFTLARVPDDVVVVGGGYIGVEMASVLRGLGARVTLVYRGPLFLRGFDDDVRSFLAEELRKKGVALRFERDVVALSRDGARILVELSDRDTLTVDGVLFATGRAPLTDGTGLAEVGVKLGRGGEILVDECFRTSVPSIFAVGDVTGKIQLTPVALAQGMAVVRTLYDGIPTSVDEDHVPTAIFSDPNVGTVGLSEAEARRRVKRVHVYRSTFTPLKHTLTGHGDKMLMKLVVDGDSDRVLGVHVVGDDAGEIVQGFAVALKAGATKAVFDATIGIHPTAAEELVTMRERVPDPAPPAPH